MQAADIASVATTMLRDDFETTVFSLCGNNGLRLVPRLGAAGAQWNGAAIVYDPEAPMAEQCGELLLAACRATLPSGSEADVLQLAELLNGRLCQAP
jgi:hypothetical protein